MNIFLIQAQRESSKNTVVHSEVIKSCKDWIPKVMEYLLVMKNISYVILTHDEVHFVRMYMCPLVAV
jgi:hypothetical protein